METESPPLILKRITDMFELIAGFVAGLIIGWNFLPQPSFIANLFKKQQ